MARASYVLRHASYLSSLPRRTQTFGFESASAFSGSVRRLNIFSIFNREAREKERLRLKDELNRGYFDDLRELKKTGGKVATASQNLVPVLAAGKFPKLTACTTTGDEISLPLENESASNTSIRATLVCMAFRASAQVSVVDSWFLSLPLVKKVLLKSMQPPAVLKGEEWLKNHVVYSFGDSYFFRKELGIPNVLVGYLFLLDNKGRVRWRASGLATSEELSSMVSCTSRLLEED